MSWCKSVEISNSSISTRDTLRSDHQDATATPKRRQQIGVSIIGGGKFGVSIIGISIISVSIISGGIIGISKFGGGSQGSRQVELSSKRKKSYICKLQSNGPSLPGAGRTSDD